MNIHGVNQDIEQMASPQFVVCEWRRFPDNLANEKLAQIRWPSFYGTRRQNVTWQRDFDYLTRYSCKARRCVSKIEHRRIMDGQNFRNSVLNEGIHHSIIYG